MAKESKKYIVYKHTTPNGKVYIGLTSKLPNKRWQNGTGYHHNEYWQSAIKKYGWENIKHEILFDNLTKEQAEQKEIELIAFYKSNQSEYGYNLASGGLVNSGFKISEETKKKMSVVHKGKKLKEETKIKISASNKGRIVSEATREKISVALKGKEIKEATREKLSIANKGKIQSKDTIEKRVYKLKGQKRTEEQIKLFRECRPNKKEVSQYDLKGTFIKTYNSIAEASRETNVNRQKISLVCLGKRNKVGGYIWRSVEREINILNA